MVVCPWKRLNAISILRLSSLPFLVSW